MVQFGDKGPDDKLGAIAQLPRLDINPQEGVGPLGVSAVTLATQEQLRLGNDALVDAVGFALSISFDAIAICM